MKSNLKKLKFTERKMLSFNFELPTSKVVVTISVKLVISKR